MDDSVDQSHFKKKEQLPTKQLDIPHDNPKSLNENTEGAISSLLKQLPELDNWFHLHKKIGEGTFSNVYLASLKGFNNDKQFAIKHLIPTCHPKRMKYELDCLNRIGGKDNVVSCDMTIRQADNVVFIMPYLHHQKFADYVLDMTVEEARMYMKNLLLALKRVHSFNIIHRDVKPSNFLYNRESKQFLLVDFGLAQKVSDYEENPQIKPPMLKTSIMKRQRDDDNDENAERPMVKRSALQTLTGDVNIKQPVKLPGKQWEKSLVQPTSEKQQMGQLQSTIFASSVKRQPLSSNSTNVISNNNQKSNKPTFQSLTSQKGLSIESGASFVRVQNSQVQTGPIFPKPTAPVRRKDQCQCTNKPQVCNSCLTRKPQYAPRAGTPGFRPPEVLLKYPNQTTAVDMWSAGIIMLCILSGCYPFFRSPDDITALSELITVFGSKAIMNLASKLGRNVICNEIRKPLNISLLCENLRRRKMEGNKTPSTQPLCKECYHPITDDYGCLCESRCKIDMAKSLFPKSAYDLLSKLLELDPSTRISAEMALQHPFIITATD